MREKECVCCNLVFTLGTGALSSSQFDEMLKHFEVSTLVDVRSKPRGWNRGLWMSSLMKRYGDRYVWLGDRLGGFDIDENYGSIRWREGIGQIKELSMNGRLVIFCAEDDPARCHRSVIAKDLENQGIEITHLRSSDYNR